MHPIPPENTRIAFYRGIASILYFKSRQISLKKRFPRSRVSRQMWHYGPGDLRQGIMHFSPVWKMYYTISLRLIGKYIFLRHVLCIIHLFFVLYIIHFIFVFSYLSCLLLHYWLLHLRCNSAIVKCNSENKVEFCNTKKTEVCQKGANSTFLSELNRFAKEKNKMF